MTIKAEHKTTKRVHTIEVTLSDNTEDSIAIVLDYFNPNRQDDGAEDFYTLEVNDHTSEVIELLREIYRAIP